MIATIVHFHYIVNRSNYYYSDRLDLLKSSDKNFRTVAKIQVFCTSLSDKPRFYIEVDLLHWLTTHVLLLRSVGRTCATGHFFCSVRFAVICIQRPLLTATRQYSQEIVV